jgi:hypothetical protein
VRTRSITAIVAVALVIGMTPITAGAGTGRPHRIRLEVTALERLDGAFYEVWVVAGERKLSAGSFNVSSDGELVDGFGHDARFFSRRDPRSADAIVVTIEPLPDRDPGPSGIVVLTGRPRRDGTARLRFPVRLGDASGSFILATPTDASNANETAGVWFLDPAAGPGPSLDVPALPDGWVFEGWGVTQGTALTTGRFVSPSGADDAAPFSGPQRGPPFPGEDFLNNLPAGVVAPVDLADGESAVVLTLEPDLAGTDPTGAGPFSIKPLLTNVPEGAADHTSTALVLDLSTIPSGSATF